MVLGSFRNRILIAIVLIFLLWQSSRIWFLSTPENSDTYEMKHDGDSSQDLKPKVPRVQKVHVRVFYEALCPDSRNFFAKQLLPTYEQISENVEVEAIPYGKAKTIKANDGYIFECQHGPTECEANMIHACAIEEIKDPKQRLEYLTCMIKRNHEPQDIMKTCAENMSIAYQSILNCYNGEHGKDLLAKYGEITEENRSKITFIPTVSLDQNFSNQPAILKNFLQQVCILLKNAPKGCTE